MSVEHFPVWDCAECGIRVYAFPAFPDAWARKQREYRVTLGLDIEQPTCLDCVIERVKETANA